MASDFPIPETKVLAIASHVVYGYVGNTMATFVMQALGCDVSALNTVHFSNHTGYRHWRGTRSSAAEISALYQGLAENSLLDFDVLLSGYAPGAEAVYAVGEIGRALKERARLEGKQFTWVLDPVMGDQGKLYVSEDVVPAYKTLIRDADLILPNQFEAEVLSGIEINSAATLKDAITVLHSRYDVPHVVVTSIRLPPISSSHSTANHHESLLSVVGSSRDTDGSPRLFRVDVPEIDVFFSGTGDMFAALIVVRFREALNAAASVSGYKNLGLQSESETAASQDSLLASKSGKDLPLARAVEKVLASMTKILEITKQERDRELAMGVQTQSTGDATKEEVNRRAYLRETKAAEVRVIRNAKWLREAEVVYNAREFE